MICSHCKKDFEESKIHAHHIQPRFMDNKAGGGMKIYLCEKCHNIIHFMIPSIYWNELSDIQKRNAIMKVSAFSMKYGDINDS